MWHEARVGQRLPRIARQALGETGGERQSHPRLQWLVTALGSMNVALFAGLIAATTALSVKSVFCGHAVGTRG